jgi:hypothetical protein
MFITFLIQLGGTIDQPQQEKRKFPRPVGVKEDVATHFSNDGGPTMFPNQLAKVPCGGVHFEDLAAGYRATLDIEGDVNAASGTHCSYGAICRNRPKICGFQIVKGDLVIAGLGQVRDWLGFSHM